jgi:Ca2+-binding EF-hand superfamily protein
MYDLNNNGFIDKPEMKKIMSAFNRMVGPMVTYSGKKYPSVNEMVDDIFDAMDLNADDKISLAEYREGALKNPDIIQGLKLFS